MLKKLVKTCVIFLSSSSLAFAGSFYLGPMVTYVSTEGNHSDSDTMHPRLSLGYGQVYDSYVTLAGEIFASPTGWSVHTTKRHGVNLKTTQQFGASVIPGYQLDNALTLYVRLGVVVSNFSKVGDYKTGYQGGAGVEVYLGGAWSARGEYDYTRYGVISTAGNVSSGTYGVGLIYRFG